IAGNRARRHCTAASRAIRRRRATAASSRVSSQRGTERRVESNVTPSTPSSVSFCTARSGLVPFVSANATTRRGSSWGSTTAAPRRELAEQLFLLRSQPRRDLDVEAHEQIAAAATLQRRHAFALEPEHLTRLRAGRYEDLLLVAFERLDRETGAERGLRERQLAHVHEVVALALELGVGRDGDRDVQIARDAAAR